MYSCHVIEIPGGIRCYWPSFPWPACTLKSDVAKTSGCLSFPQLQIEPSSHFYSWVTVVPKSGLEPLISMWQTSVLTLMPLRYPIKRELGFNLREEKKKNTSEEFLKKNSHISSLLLWMVMTGEHILQECPNIRSTEKTDAANTCISSREATMGCTTNPADHRLL